MTQYNTLNVKLSNSQLNKLKSGIKNGNEVNLSSIVQSERFVYKALDQFLNPDKTIKKY